MAVIVRPQAAQKSQSLQIDIGDILAENLLGDSLRLRQILVNIIGNAVKYTQSGGCIQVRFFQLPASSRGGRPAVRLVFSCRDNAPWRVSPPTALCIPGCSIVIVKCPGS